MSYETFREKHSDWPVRMRDLEGRLVRLTRQVETRGGKVYAPGAVYIVSSVHRGLLTLSQKLRAPIPEGDWIRGVWRDNVKLLPFDEPTCRFCHCTTTRACQGGCAWAAIELDSRAGICTACVATSRYAKDALEAVQRQGLEVLQRKVR